MILQLFFFHSNTLTIAKGINIVKLLYEYGTPSQAAYSTYTIMIATADFSPILNNTSNISGTSDIVGTFGRGLTFWETGCKS